MCSVDNELSILKKGFEELGIICSEAILNKFRLYLKILYEAKGCIHLISHNDYKRISLKHFLPSLTALKFINNEETACDIGAGAGFPSVPIKILKPELEFVLFESVKKKADFLRYLIGELKLDRIYVMNIRAEEYKESNFDVIFIRAAGRIKRLVKTVYNLLNPGGKAIFFKSPNISQEVNEAKKEIEKYNLTIHIEKFETPVTNEPLCLIFLHKQKK